jgi:hypothetical protein
VLDDFDVEPVCQSLKAVAHFVFDEQNCIGCTFFVCALLHRFKYSAVFDALKNAAFDILFT